MRNHSNENGGGGAISHATPSTDAKRASPIAICGMALRLPGGLESPQQFWDFLVAKGDARGRVPESRYNISAYYSRSGRPGTIGTEHGYFLGDDVQLGALDAGRFSISRAELECADPQQRRMLEVVRECLDDAGEVGFRGAQIGCYMGSYGEDWLEMQNRDPQQSGIYRLDGYGDFMLSNRISYEMDLRGPSMTIRTACSSALVGLHEACLAIQQGHCKSAVVGGANLILAPGAMASMTEKGVLSPDGSCKTFSADANGYARGEAITAIYIKPLDVAIRDGNPIRAVIRSSMSNNDGKTPGMSCPSTESQVAMMRETYREAGITDFSQTAFVECHGTGTAVGDPIEANAVAQVFGDSGVFIGSVKPNLGHSEGASGITSVIKAVLALEHRTIPPNIKFSSPNPAIPFGERRLVVPLEPTPWPESRSERVSVNSFGIGGSNAHVVLDSSRSFHVPAPARADLRLAAGPHLLLLSAGSAASLQRMALDLQAWLADGERELQHVAYTLAHRREHLPHRAFMVARRHQPAVSSPGKKANSARPPNLVMVFSGQGAQWARMGRELLLRPDLCFQSSIRSLDRFLQEAQLQFSATSPASKTSCPWSLEEELLKPARTSRVHEAEFSQPLCTAIQIALVDIFASVGVEPVAVVGHSSGEIAAAYAAGALTAREAVITAWQRGQAARSQTRQGAMAAVSLGWDQVKSFLPTSDPPSVVVACENSPRNVTLSGDAADVEAAVSHIKQAHPGVTARLLKVDKAYHSYHMREVGQEYCSSMGKVLLHGKAPLKPFFSSVTARREEGVLDAAYWQKNLESPVLFKSAVSLVLGEIDNVAFLEVGPHSALAGPLRQISSAWQEATGNTVASPPYVSALARGEDSAESFLTAMGKLFELNASVDLQALIPTGSCLPDLPRYQWDHSDGDYWRESRMSHEWRCRQHAGHPLLGVRQLESTSLEPSWRNVLHVDKVAWLRDHKVEDLIIFPCAGYVAMAGEAIAQVAAGAAGRAGFSLRHVVISAALVINEGSPVELVTTLRPYRLTDSLDSQWWEFAISSHNGHVWTKHITGQVCAADTVIDDETTPVGLLPRAFDVSRYYSILDRAGLQYGPHFRRLADIRTGTTQQLATARVVTPADTSAGDEDDYHVHPTAVDACFQTISLAAFRGRMGAKQCRGVPTKIKKLTIRRPVSRPGDGVNKIMNVSASATVTVGSGDIVGLVQQGVVDGRVVLHMEGMTVSPLEEAEGGGGDFGGADGLPTTARLLWGPHIDFLDAAKLIRPSIPRHLYAPALEALTRLSQVYAQRRMAESCSRAGLPHMVKYRSWVDAQVGQASSVGSGDEDDSFAALQRLRDDTIMEKMADIVSRLAGTPVAACATAVQKVALNMSGLYTGDTEALEILLADDTLTQVYIATDACDRSEFIRHLAHSKPNLRILEIGAGTGASTMSMLKHLVLPGAGGDGDGDGEGSGRHPLYSRYTFTDISSAFFVAAKERFKGYSNIEYRTLDISKDPGEQGFEVADRYDLVIATNVLHATRRLGETLRNVHGLLAPGGRLLLHELYSRSKWPNFVFGTLPGWWLGEDDGRPGEPCVEPARWEEGLTRAGFAGMDALVLDAEEPYQLNAIMVAKPRQQLAGDKGKKTVTLLCDDDDDDNNANDLNNNNNNNNKNNKKSDSSVADLLARQLELRGYNVNQCKLGDELPTGPLDDIISLLDLGPRGPFFQAISEARFAAFQSLLEKLASSSSSSSSSSAGDGRRPCMLWVTRPCQVRCRDPGYAQVIGAARTIRTEMLLSLATCEVDDVDGCGGGSSWPPLGRVVDVFARFRETGAAAGDDGSLDPDYEFAIVDGTVMVGRAYPFSLRDDEPLLPERVGADAAGLSLGMTRPGRLATMGWNPREARELKGDEVEVEVYAIGLNFKQDVLCALGVVPFPKGGLGSESSGVVRRVGPEVKDLCVGDRVFLMADGSFATHVIGIERMCERIPATLPFEEAVTMPAVFTTTVAALLNIGRLGKGQSLLIHSACGGVGLAAIQLARMVGAEIYATVGSQEKIEYLTDKVGLPRNRIFSSRDTSFVEGLMRETGGKGVDLALNSLSGELLHATWHSVAEFGRMVEIGKRDILGAGKLDMDVFLTNRGYTCFCLDHLAQNRPAAFKELFQWVRKHLEEGKIRPIQRARVFDASSLEEALRYMQKGQHIGKIVISMRDAEGTAKINTSPVKAARKLQLDRSASYMLVGGLGGLGRSVSRHLVDHGARRLVYLSRSAGTGPGDADFVRELESMGCEVVLVRGSVTSADDVSRAVRQAPSLRGVLQCSMVLSDAAFSRMSLEEWNTAVAPKVQGTWNLHNASVSAGARLDFFVLFSSMSGLTGQAGQANYAGANTFLNAFVQYRNSLGLAASAVDIGAVQDVGYVSQDAALLRRMMLASAHGITEHELLEALTAAMLFPPGPRGNKASSDPAETAFEDRNTFILGLGTKIPLSSPDSRAFWRKDRRMAVYHNSSKAGRDDGGPNNDNLKAFLARARSDASLLKAPDTAAFLAREVGRKLFSFLLKPEEDLNMSVPLSQLGMDSLVGVEMRSWWRQAFGFDITVLELLGSGNLSALGSHAAEGLFKVLDSKG
ncbi:putative polyketide synthase [Diaporthe ampelina]|uniref:Putative polyketide synthase n=1 Tax=Diaporthe ampelina TaxID=1214573 RepID=A0A0G2G124_9PEZI|nr:putative polyketide synthase [Diaporthe ampelina]